VSTATTQFWPWAALAGLGIMHGVNPAMGWLFAVALGLYRQQRRVVLLSVVPIALGHAVSVALVLLLFLGFGQVIDRAFMSRAAAALLIAWALWHAVRGHRQRPRVGMQTGFIGLGLWSFLMASTHGAGLMAIPVLLPLCPSDPATHSVAGDGSTSVALAALGVHTLAMLATIMVVSVAVYEWVGVGFLRSGWVNFDLVWTVALLVCGVVLIIA
jgi:hypothetical protein